MAITSIPPTRPIVKISDALNGSRCVTCQSPVELTSSLLLKGGRIVGCRGCDWGAVRAPAPHVMRDIDRASDRRALS